MDSLIVPSIILLLGKIRMSFVVRIGARWPGKTAGVRRLCAGKHCFSLTFSLFRFFCVKTKEMKDQRHLRIKYGELQAMTL